MLQPFYMYDSNFQRYVIKSNDICMYYVNSQISYVNHLFTTSEPIMTYDVPKYNDTCMSNSQISYVNPHCATSEPM